MYAVIAQLLLLMKRSSGVGNSTWQLESFIFQSKWLFLYLHLNIIGPDTLGFLAECLAGRRVPANTLAPLSLLEAKQHMSLSLKEPPLTLGSAPQALAGPRSLHLLLPRPTPVEWEALRRWFYLPAICVSVNHRWITKRQCHWKTFSWD